MIFGWFETTQAKQIGVELAAMVVAKIPLDSISLRGARTKRDKVLTQVLDQGERRATEKKLNAFKRAKLANIFQKELMRAGYSTEFVREVTEGLVMRLGFRPKL